MVTGAAGFIGSHLVKELRSSGERVIALDRRPLPGADDFPSLRGPLREIRGDLNSLPLVEYLKGVSVVYHLAALPGVRPSWVRFSEYLQCNVLATQRLLDACVRAGVPRVVVASSSSVYGGTTGVMSEDDLPRPLSPYGVTKLAAERLALAFAARGDTALSVGALRFFTVYGPGQRPDMFISRLIRSTLRSEPLEIYGDGSQVRDFTHVSDVVRALTLAGAAREKGGTVLNIGTGNTASVNEVVSMTAELTGLHPAVEYGAAREGDAPSTSADVSRARSRLGFTALTGLREGLTTQIDWARTSGRAGVGTVPLGGATSSPRG
ncbi:NAD-dependent epimerase/dehydratase family protein [Streptomyces calidiresistens]|uniref:NAD-dependent epimerase/dehydratase family protein n=1 Tax=Streptomyces calidiresistens TaxID=1485586 RepID=A0A7W3SZR2_9ACTN|nr:NAD-dependent epimerase/dehydratase family protein [Streptomyces calidiresistens]